MGMVSLDVLFVRARMRYVLVYGLMEQLGNCATAHRLSAGGDGSSRELPQPGCHQICWQWMFCVQNLPEGPERAAVAPPQVARNPAGGCPGGPAAEIRVIWH